MKNTMKIKSLLSFFVPAAILSLSVASCSDYDNGYTESAIKFQEEFKKAYGDIDPEQDWNLAERGTVTVSTTKESEIKIYALRGNEYVLVGDYEGVSSTRVLGFDMLEGTKSIMVTDGVTAVKTIPGDVVTFGGTRTVYEDPNDANEDGIKVTKLTSNVTFDNDETFPAYRTASKSEIDGMLNTVPQGVNNLNSVTHDFTYVSTGSFIIYPYYWYTISENTLGIYYTDATGGYHEVDIYKAKGEHNSGEIWYSDNTTITDDYTNWHYDHDSNSGAFYSLKRQDSSGDDQGDPSGVVAPFMEYWRAPATGICHVKFSKEFTVSANEEYIVEVVARLRNQNNSSTDNMGVVTLTANNQSVKLTDEGNYAKDVYSYGNKTEGNLYSNMNGTGKIWVKCVADENGKIKVEWDINTNNATNPANWFSFKDLKIMEAAGNYEYFDQNGLSSVKGQGIKVDIPEGTKFGMYLKKSDASGDYTIYSEGSKNERDNRLVGDQGQYSSCYASTFHVGDQLFLGFEDWPATTGGDYDLNDMIFTFDGYKPVIINEDPKSYSWLLVCEDLGGSFDTDYNDVIFLVEHVSGQTKAKVTAMAAGGTLASYIVFRDPTTTNAPDQVLGEIHQLFNVTPEASGAYSPINAYSRYEKTGNTVSFDVSENWTMAWYSTNTWQSEGTNYGEGVNMGGFKIYTLPAGTPAPSVNATVNDLGGNVSVIAAPGPGSAPYMLCLPYTYTKDEGDQRKTYVWAWPRELCTICSATYNNGKYSGANGGAYTDFGAWVRSYQDNEWYKNRTNDLTVEELVLSSQGISQQTSLGNNGDFTSLVGEEIDLYAQLTNIPNNVASISYKLTVPGVVSNYNVDGGIISPDKAGEHQFTVTVTTTNGGTETTTFTVWVNKKASPLGNKGDMSITAGQTADLYSNLENATVSGGAITYQYVQYGETKDCSSPFGPLYNTGDRTIVVRQAETNEYYAGTTTFTLTVNSSSSEGDKVLITNLDGATTGSMFGSNAYFVPKEVFAGATSIIVTVEGNDIEYFVNDNRQWSNYTEHRTESTYDVGANGHLQDVIYYGLAVGVQKNFDTTKVYVTIKK